MSQFYIHFVSGSFGHGIRHEPIVIPESKMAACPEKEFFTDLDDSKNDSLLFALKLYGIVYKAMGLIPKSAYHCEKEGGMDDRVAAALEYISDKYMNHRVIEGFCRNNGISVNHLTRLFHHDIGVTPKQYQMGCRIHEARNLLENQVISIDEIAERCGFANRYDFSKAFKKYVGTPPAAYRNSRKHLTVVR